MSNDRSVAGKILDDAKEAVTKTRTGHGDTQASFEMIGALWNVYLAHMHRARRTPQIRAEDVAQMMVHVKQARALYGDPSNLDNSTDAAGYSALAGMLAAPEAEFHKVQPGVAQKAHKAKSKRRR